VVDIEREWGGINLGPFSLDIYYYNFSFQPILRNKTTKVFKQIHLSM
jgi:hypothetical protein